MSSAGSDLFGVGDSKRTWIGCAGVEGANRFEEEDADFFCGDWTVFDASRYNQEFAGLERDGVGEAGGVAVLHFEFALDDEEEFVFRRVMVPDEISSKLDQLDVLPIEFGDDFGGPVGSELVELFT